MSADDQQHFNLDPNSPELDLHYTPGNRPASGARRATPGEVLSQGFQGAQNAGDFLGLDTEFTANFDPFQVPASSGLDQAGPPTTAGGYQTEESREAPPDADPYQASESASAFHYGEDLGEEHEDYGDGFAPEPVPTSSSRPVLLSLGVALVGFGAVYFSSDLRSLFFGSSEPQVAQVSPDPAKVKTPPSASTGPAPVPSTQTPTEVAGGSIETPSVQVVPESAQKVPVSNPSSNPLGPTGAKQEPTTARSPGGQRTPLPTSGAQGTEQQPENTTESVASLVPLPTPSPKAFPTLTGADYQWASEDLLELIWRGDSIPMEAIRAPAKTLMPRVGLVRVFTTSGDLFDGRLYAVGQNRVWIDTEPGRVGLDGDRVERIETMTASAPRDGSERAVPGRRVRVSVPGGMLFGNVLKTEGDNVMLLLDDGGKVRVRANDLQELGSGRAIVVGR